MTSTWSTAGHGSAPPLGASLSNTAGRREGRLTEDDLGVGGGFALSVLLRDGEEVFLTYATTGRGVDRLRLDFNLLDLYPYGRQEEWEDSPNG